VVYVLRFNVLQDVRLLDSQAEGHAGDATREGDGASAGEAILVFLPGLREIDDVAAAMDLHPILGDPSRCLLLKLSSSGGGGGGSTAAVFAPVPLGMTKIILSTNVAETSITIDDVTSVIDTGTHKEMAIDQEPPDAVGSAKSGSGRAFAASSLRMCRVSRAAAAQRAGRAGRTRPGECAAL
jgi:HrpA-like RNA helicase